MGEVDLRWQKAVHEAWTNPGSTVVVVSPTGRQSGEFVRKAGHFLAKLGERPRGDGTNQISLKLGNGSRIIGLPAVEATVRGFSAVSLLLVDEAARVNDDLFQAIKPMLAVMAINAVYETIVEREVRREWRSDVADEHAVRAAGVLL